MSDPAATQRLSGLPLVAATLAVALASFMNVLDTTIAIVSLPTISGNLGATPSQGSWVITSYSVCLAVVLPLSGWITRRFGEVHTFCFAVMMFTVTSWLCAIAGSFNQLLLFRALQGLSGGLLLPLSQSLLMRIYPPEKHGLALGIWGITSAVAPVIGPLLGGVITDRLGWPWIFLINLPVGLFSVLTSWSLLRRSESERFREPVDGVGLLLLFVGVVCFQLVLDRGHELDWLASRPIQVMLVISILFFFLFLAWEWGEKHPVVDFSLFRYRSFVVGSTLLSVVYTTLVVGTVIYPIWMQSSMGYTATWSGIVMSPMGLAPILLMPLVGQKLRGWDPRFTVSLGVFLWGVAFYLQAQTSTDSTAGYMAFARFAMGVAMPFAWMPLLVVTLVGLPPEKVASATGLFNFFRMLASSLGTAIGMTLWDERTIFHRSRLAETLSPESPQYQQAMALLAGRVPEPASALAALDRAVTVQGRTLALDEIFYICVGLSLLVALAAWALPSHRETH